MLFLKVQGDMPPSILADSKIEQSIVTLPLDIS